MPVYLVESHRLPLLTATVVSRYGSAAGPAGLDGLATVTAAMLRQGTPNRSAEELSAEVADFGGKLTSDATSDGATLSIGALSTDADHVAGLLAAMVRTPALRAADLTRTASDLTGLVSQQNDDQTEDAEAVSLAGGPRGNPPLRSLPGRFEGRPRPDQGRGRGGVPRPRLDAQPDRPGAVRGSDAGSGHRDRGGRVRGLDRLRAAATGAPDPGHRAEGGRPGGYAGQHPDRAARGRTGPGAHRPETTNRCRSPTRSWVACSTSRLSQNLRELHGYTYGAYSRLGLGRGPAPFAMSATVEARHTGDSVKQILAEFNRWRDTEVTAEELERGRQSLVAGIPALFSTTDEAARLAAPDVPGPA